ncbi:GNAT family N-acetyltransferase [Bacillus haynesii]|uniref:GNAT family N-acetyltransferase n=1 Tax=Bacillus haynesii TaxID=1925021 RepID=UPI001F61292E|nr:GNAT family N-acetyltransferase [Bacillus haynesii]MCI4129589.1 GNAT family N-acetyltransferase [Bacillus haynesii]
MIQYRLASADHLDEVAQLFHESFDNYPFMDLLVRPEKKNPQFLYELHKVITQAYINRQGCFIGVVNGEIVTAALLKHRDDPDVGVLDYISAGGIKLFIKGGLSAVWNMVNVAEEAKRSYKGIKQQKWYLEALGVSRFHQGKSFGSKMINDCLVPFIRRNGGGILALINNTNINRSFYKKNGFDEFSAFPLKRFGREIGNWSFKRTIY